MKKLTSKALSISWGRGQHSTTWGRRKGRSAWRKKGEWREGKGKKKEMERVRGRISILLFIYSGTDLYTTQYTLSILLSILLSKLSVYYSVNSLSSVVTMSLFLICRFKNDISFLSFFS